MALRIPSNIALCFDGTWNSDDASSPTNVVKTYQAIRPVTSEGVEQLTYYDRGVGTGRFDRFRGGVLGLGLARNVEIAYQWLTANYLPRDRLFLFGYSRGAYTARSLAGLIGLCGIPDAGRCAFAGCRPAEVARRAMAIYRMRTGKAREEGAARHRETFCRVPGAPEFRGADVSPALERGPLRRRLGHRRRPRRAGHLAELDRRPPPPLPRRAARPPHPPRLPRGCRWTRAAVPSRPPCG